MKYHRIFKEILQKPWLITAAAHHGMIDQLEAWLAGLRGEAMEGTPGQRSDVREPDAVKGEHGQMEKIEYFVNRGGVGHVSVTGVLGRKLDWFERWCGGADVNLLMHSVERAVQDESVHTVLIDFDSPGGAVTGAEEAARFIHQANAQKPVVGYTERMSCSASQWLMAACGASYAAPSADVGSIGVYLYWLDESRRLLDSGIDPVLFQAGTHKGIGLPGRGLSEEDAALLQSEVDATHAQFKAAVREFRGVDIADEWMEGQTLSGAQAAEVGLVDGTVDTFDEMLIAVGAEI